jgi:hypothetical protein
MIYIVGYIMFVVLVMIFWKAFAYSKDDQGG